MPSLRKSVTRQVNKKDTPTAIPPTHGIPLGIRKLCFKDNLLHQDKINAPNDRLAKIIRKYFKYICFIWRILKQTVELFTGTTIISSYDWLANWKRLS
jgi:hypothetical protein